MIRLDWNLPASLQYTPGLPIELALTLSNPSEETEKDVVVLMLLDERGYLTVNPSTGKPNYYALVQSDSSFTLSESEATLFTLESGAELSLSASVTPGMTNCILSLASLDEEQKEMFDVLFCHIFSVSMMEMMTTQVIPAVLVAGMVGMMGMEAMK
jgi:hypothetical protein